MTWLRKETVLVVSALLAAGSCFLVKPDEEYLSYFSGNTDTILILFCLMTVVAGLGSLGISLCGTEPFEKNPLRAGNCAASCIFMLLWQYGNHQ